MPGRIRRWSVDNLSPTQLQALAGSKWDGTIEGWPVDANDKGIEPSEVQALALEVLASRERRCGNCASYLPAENWCDEEHGTNGPDFFCADFQPKEPR